MKNCNDGALSIKLTIETELTPFFVAEAGLSYQIAT